MRGGYVLNHRAVYENPAFKDMVEASVFIWMFTMAAWQPTRVRYKERVVNLGRGDLAISVRDFAQKWGWSRGRVEKFLKRLEKEDMVKTGGKTGVNVITICNYDKYQASEDREKTPASQDRRHREDTGKTQNNEGNEVKERNNTDRARENRKGETELEEDWQPNERAYEYGRNEGYSDDEVRWLADRFRNHWRAKRARKRDWHRTFLNWLSSSYSHRDIDQRRRSSGAVGGRGKPQATGRVAAIRRVASSVQQQSEQPHAGGIPRLGDERGSDSDSGGEPNAGRSGDAGTCPNGIGAADQSEGGRFRDGGYAGGAVHGPDEHIPGGRGYPRLQVVGE